MHVVLDHCEMRVGAGRRRHVRRRHLERRTSAATDALERVVRRRLRVLDPPVSAAEANVAKRNAGIRRLPYIVRPIEKRPAGVDPSPSRRFARTPFLPTRAVYGPSTGSQQPPSPRAQVLALASVDLAVAARTVINCREAVSAGVARSLARSRDTWPRQWSRAGPPGASGHVNDHSRGVGFGRTDEHHC